MISRPSSRRFLRLAGAPVAAAIVLAAVPAFAQSNDCPPGSWFCADTDEKPAAPAGKPVAPAPAPTPAPKADSLEPLPPPASERPAPPPKPPPPVIIYQRPRRAAAGRRLSAAAPRRRRRRRFEAPPPYYYRPRPATSGPRKNEWGLNLRLEGAILGGKSARELRHGRDRRGASLQAGAVLRARGGSRRLRRARLLRQPAPGDVVRDQRALLREPAVEDAGLLPRRVRLVGRHGRERQPGLVRRLDELSLLRRAVGAGSSSGSPRTSRSTSTCAGSCAGARTTTRTPIPSSSTRAPGARRTPPAAGSSPAA